MYLFSSMLIPCVAFQPQKQQLWGKKFSHAFLPANQVICKSHIVGHWQFQLTFILPCHRTLTYFTDANEWVTFYIFGDLGFHAIEDYKDRVINDYHAGHFYRLSELPFFYNLIIIDKRLEKIFFICDSYYGQTLYYHQFEHQTLVTNTQKAIVSYPDFKACFDKQEIMNTLLLGTQYPERTLIKGVNRIAPGYYLKLPELECLKIKFPEFEKNENLTMQDCVETIYQFSLEALEPYTTKGSVGVLFSGGNDSSSIAKLLQKKRGDDIYCLSYLAHSNDMNRYNIEAAGELLNIRTNFVNYSEQTLFQNQAMAVWHGESEIVGLNSLNATLEMALAQTLSSKTCAWTGGEMYQIPLKLQLQSSGSILEKFRIILNAKLLTEKESHDLNLSFDTLSLWDKLKNRVQYLNYGEILSEFCLPIFPGAVYRLRNRSIHFSSHYFLLNRNIRMNEFFATIPDNLIQKMTSNHQGKVTVLLDELFKKVLGTFYATRQKKAWMESFIRPQQRNTIRQELKLKLLNESPYVHEILGDDLSKMVNGEHILHRYDELLFCLWSMELFAQQFFV